MFISYNFSFMKQKKSLPLLDSSNSKIESQQNQIKIFCIPDSFTQNWIKNIYSIIVKHKTYKEINLWKQKNVQKSKIQNKDRVESAAIGSMAATEGQVFGLTTICVWTLC